MLRRFMKVVDHCIQSVVTVSIAIEQSDFCIQLSVRYCL